jgi:hypothetical protein
MVRPVPFVTPARPAMSAVGVLAASVLLVGAALTGCGSDQRSGSVLLAVNDQNLRTPGVECSGGGSLMYVHAGAEYRIVDEAQRTLHSGTLPAGTAEPALDVDFGTKAVRIPTACTMTIDLDVAPAADPAWLVVAGGKPIALRASGTAGSWTAQIPEAAAEWTPSAAPTSAGSEGTG